MDKTPGRNDPCHCGSGLKYKKCHANSDREAAGSPPLHLLPNAPEPVRRRMLGLPTVEQLNREWEVDIAPVPATFADDPAARPAAILVAAPPFVISAEMVSRPSAEPEELAGLLAAEILKGAENTGVTPAHVSIRHAELANPLARALKATGIAVRVAEQLPGVEDALRSLLGHVYGGIVPLHLLRAKPEMWAGWGMSIERVAKLFRAAANFYRAAPWEIAIDEWPVYVRRPDGHEWTTIIMGAAGQQIGLAMYEDADAVEQMQEVNSTDPTIALSVIRGLTVSLLFNTRAELPKPMRAEIQRAGWDIAGPNAYPTLLVLNSPGGGLREQHFDDVIAALESVPRCVRLQSGIFKGVAPGASDVTWVDPENHATCRLEVEPALFESLGVVPTVLEPSGPTGPGAMPLASLSAQDAARSVNRALTRYRAWLRKPVSGMTPPVAFVRTCADYARWFAERCAYASGKPVNAVTEYEVREFLYDWYPRIVRDRESGALEMLRHCTRSSSFLRSANTWFVRGCGPYLRTSERLRHAGTASPVVTSGMRLCRNGSRCLRSILLVDYSCPSIARPAALNGGRAWGSWSMRCIAKRIGYGW